MAGSAQSLRHDQRHAVRRRRQSGSTSQMGEAHMSAANYTPEASRNFKVVGQSDLAGRGDALQVMVANGHAYIGHRISRGISVVDVRDPRHPKPVNFVPVHRNSWTIHLQTHDNLCLLYTSPSPRDGLLSRMPSSA